MLTRGAPARTYGVANPPPVVADGAQRQGTDGKGNDYTWAIARPANSPAPSMTAPHYLTNVPARVQHNRSGMTGGTVPLSLRPNPAVGTGAA